MNIMQLIQTLEEMVEIHGENCDVLLAIQPSWAFEHNIGPIAAVQPEDDSQPVTIYIGEGTQIRYLPGAAKEELWG